jgi:undecaprenyl-diphosphatase
MTILQAIILGIIQGLTEFLPISSSGHLVIVPYLLGWQLPPQDAFIFDVLVQVATLLAVFAYFWRDLVDIGRAFLLGLRHKKPFDDPNARLGWYLVLATLPAGVIGLAVKDIVEAAFASPTAAAFFLLVTAGLLIVAERVGKSQRELDQLNWKDALWVGFAQALAIFPGVSRSGATIVGGMTRDLKRPPAARFSFLISIPIMLAAGLLTTLDLFKMPHLGSILPAFIPGFIASAVVGYLSIRWLLAFLTHRPLYIFSIYCTVLGLLVLGLSLAS